MFIRFFEGEGTGQFRGPRGYVPDMLSTT